MRVFVYVNHSVSVCMLAVYVYVILYNSYTIFSQLSYI